MSNLASIPEEQFEYLNDRISHLEGVLYKIAEKMGVPTEELEGSAAWWEKEIQEGLEDIKHGRYTTLKTPEELQQFLDSLK